MAEFDVTATLEGVNFGPASLQEEVLQNVRTILATRRGTVPLDRSLGVAWDFVDLPLEVARARISQDVIDAIEENEPRAEIVRVTFAGDGVEGSLKPTVRIRINGNR